MRTTPPSRLPGHLAHWVGARPFAKLPVAVGARCSLLVTLALAGCFVSKGDLADWAGPEGGDAQDSEPAADDGVDGGSAEGAADGGTGDASAGDGGAEDGAADGSASDGGAGDGGAGDGGVTNSAPSRPEVGMAEALPLTTEDLEVLILTPSTDGDGDAVSYRYAWTQDGALRTDLIGPVVPASETARGERWDVEVVATDGAADSAGASASALVQNSAPEVSSVSLSPATARTDDTLTANVLGSDADGDALTYTYAWTVNGTSVGSSSATLSGATYFSKGDVVQVAVTPTDGTSSGSGVLSDPVTVQNSPPNAPTVTVSPSSPRAGRSLDCSASSADPDGDTVTYSYSWTVDGLAHPGATASVAMGETLPGEVWACVVAASDGSATNSASSSTTTRANSCSDGAVALTTSGIDFVTVCGGTFDMGCTPGQSSCESNESPVRSTTLTRDYYISRTEVTQGQFASVMGYNPSFFTACGGNCPVEDLTWHQAAEFTNAVSSLAGLPECYPCTVSGGIATCTPPADPYACGGYRLPTEAEWERAARCGGDLRYAGSDLVDDVAWTDLNADRSTAEVGGLAPNACGLYDMSGNVLEWVNDWYSSTAYSGGASTDPVGGASGAYRVLRGGCWQFPAGHARVAWRTDYVPSARSDRLGVRLVRTAP
jgi:formylglycine-generating enzyme required for sulfatase activity